MSHGAGGGPRRAGAHGHANTPDMLADMVHRVEDLPALVILGVFGHLGLSTLAELERSASPEIRTLARTQKWRAVAAGTWRQDRWNVALPVLVHMAEHQHSPPCGMGELLLQLKGSQVNHLPTLVPWVLRHARSLALVLEEVTLAQVGMVQQACGTGKVTSLAISYHKLVPSGVVASLAIPDSLRHLHIRSFLLLDFLHQVEVPGGVRSLSIASDIELPAQLPSLPQGLVSLALSLTVIADFSLFVDLLPRGLHQLLVTRGLRMAVGILPEAASRLPLPKHNLVTLPLPVTHESLDGLVVAPGDEELLFRPGIALDFAQYCFPALPQFRLCEPWLLSQEQAAGATHSLLTRLPAIRHMVVDSWSEEDNSQVVFPLQLESLQLTVHSPGSPFGIAHETLAKVELHQCNVDSLRLPCLISALFHLCRIGPRALTALSCPRLMSLELDNCAASGQTPAVFLLLPPTITRLSVILGNLSSLLPAIESLSLTLLKLDRVNWSSRDHQSARFPATLILLELSSGWSHREGVALAHLLQLTHLHLHDGQVNLALLTCPPLLRLLRLERMRFFCPTVLSALPQTPRLETLELNLCGPWVFDIPLPPTLKHLSLHRSIGTKAPTPGYRLPCLQLLDLKWCGSSPGQWPLPDSLTELKCGDGTLPRLPNLRRLELERIPGGAALSALLQSLAMTEITV